MNIALSKLREAIEAKTGKKPETNKDFEFLSNCINDELHYRVSTTTLKRIWGYLSEEVVPRQYTLNQLARFVGYADWQAFCSSHGGSEITTHPTSPETTLPPESSNTKSRLSSKGLLILVALVAVAAVALLLLLPHSSTSTNLEDDPRILKKGQVFATYDDFLPLFGITATESRHYQFVPGQEDIVVWSPQYHNPIYHNDGNPDSLMPTITEYWTPVTEDGEDTEELKEMIRQRQREAYYNFIAKNQVRIVFMKDLIDTTFVFLGVYRTDLLLSDTTKIVWVRAADQCDLDNIPFVKNYGNY